MSRTGWVILGVAVASLAAGGAGGYLIADKRLREHYDNVVREEVAELREFYKKEFKTDEYSTPTSAAAVLIPEEERNEFVAEAPSEEMKAASDALKSYSGSDPRPELKNIFDATPNWNQEVEVSMRDTSRPYVVSQEEYLENDLDHEQLTITYYDGDSTLADSMDEALNPGDVERLVGPDFVLHFGRGSNDPNIVYIRNEKIETDFEILKVDGGYAEVVLGHKAATRRRPGDDE